MPGYRSQSLGYKPGLRRTRMGNPWIVVPLFFILLPVGVILSIATILVLAEITRSGAMPILDAQVIDWSEKLLGICVALAGSVAAILIAQSTLRQSDNLTTFEAELKEKDTEEQRSKEQEEKLQIGLERWKQFLSSVEQLFETADEVAGDIIQRMIDTDWKEQEFEMELDRNSLRASRQRFFRALRALETLDEPHRISSLWQATFDSASQNKSSSAAIMKAARRPNDGNSPIHYKDLALDFHGLMGIVTMSTVDAINCLAARERIVDLYDRKLRDLTYQSLGLIPDHLRSINAKMAKVKTKLSEIDYDDSSIERNALEKERLEEEREHLVERLDELSGDIKHAHYFEKFDLGETLIERNDKLEELEDVQKALNEISDFANELDDVIEESKYEIDQIVSDLGPKIEDLERLEPKTSDFRSYQKVLVKIFVQSRRENILDGQDATLRDEILGAIASLIVQPDGLSVHLSEGQKEASLGLAFLIDLLRCVPEYTESIFDQLGLIGEGSPICKFNHPPVTSEIGGLAQRILEKAAHYPERFLLQMELADKADVCAIAGKVVRSKLDSFCTELVYSPTRTSDFEEQK